MYKSKNIVNKLKSPENYNYLELFENPKNKNNLNFAFDIKSNKTYFISKIDENKLINFKNKILKFLKKIRYFIINKDVSWKIKKISIILIKKVKENYSFYFKHDILLILKIFKIIIFFVLKEYETYNININLILGNWKESELFVITQSYLLIEKILQDIAF